MTPSAYRTYHARKARTRLNLAAGHLEGAVEELRQADLGRLGVTTARALADVYEVLRDVLMTKAAATGGRP